MPSSETQASANPVTNSVWLPELRPADYLQIARENRLPQSFLAVFLHEYAHHYCIRSAVGRTTSILKVERNVALGRGVESDESEVILPEVTRRGDSAEKILGPLLEGVALFAEHDVFPGSSKMVSSLASWVHTLFRNDVRAGEEPLTLERVEGFTRELLSVMRQSLSWVDRKAHLLLQPLDVRSGGYLVGYLAVKNLWLVARERSARLKDADLFLAYFFALVFDDVELVKILLRDDLPERARVMQILQRLDSRFQQLLRRDLDQHVAEFESVVLRSPAKGEKPNEYFQSIFLERSVAEEQERLMTKRIGGMLSRATHQSDTFDSIAAAAIYHHELMRLGVAKVLVTVTESGRCVATYGSETVLDEPAQPDAVPGKDQGILALYLDPDSLQSILLCLRGREEVFAIWPKNVGKEQRKKTAFSVHVTALVEPSFQVLDELARTLIPRAEDSAWFAKDLEQAVYQTYRRLALGFVEPDRREECEEAMREEGFRRVIDSRPELARSLALAGLMSSCRRRNESAGPMFAYHGLDFADCRQRVEACARQWGYPLLSPDPNQERPLDPKGHIACMV